MHNIFNPYDTEVVIYKSKIIKFDIFQHTNKLSHVQFSMCIDVRLEYYVVCFQQTRTINPCIWEINSVYQIKYK
jgi:hypothetical protein